jgi:cyanophycinase-like exopeptidase
MKDDKQLVQNLLEKRKTLRIEKKYSEADEIRKEIESFGYDLIDDVNGTRVVKKEESIKNRNTKQFLVLFGSGETSSVGRSTYDYVLKQIDKKHINISIITTPAGFQPNVISVHEEIADFMKTGLKNFQPQVSIIYANDSQKANDPNIVNGLNGSDLIFMGPGSPTYALHNLQNTLLLEKITELFKNNASIFLSSAAVLTFSRYTLPVYEIFKVGASLYWEKGLDFFSSRMNETTLIPHCNNTEGMPKLDTSYCFMGKDRFNRLRTLLSPKESVLGIDEQTALIVDLQSHNQTIIGKGTTHSL